MSDIGVSCPMGVATLEAAPEGYAETTEIVNSDASDGGRLRHTVEE
jgi:hypothetical protein